jgi:hypothetical protein
MNIIKFTIIANAQIAFSYFLCLLLLLTSTASHISAQNVGIGVDKPLALLHIDGHMKIDGPHSIEFGANHAGKDPNAGKIGYGYSTPGALDIFGGGTSNNNRRLVLWAEGGTLFKGSIEANGNLSITGTASMDKDLTVNGNLNIGLTSNFIDYTLSANTIGYYSINCPGGTRIVTGGGGHRDQNTAATDITVNYSGPNANSPLTSWRVTLSNTNAAASRAVRVYCICARIN